MSAVKDIPVAHVVVGVTHFVVSGIQWEPGVVSVDKVSCKRTGAARSTTKPPTLNAKPSTLGPQP